MPEEQALPVTNWRGADLLTYDTWAQIRALHQQGHSIRQIARGLDVARNTVREAPAEHRAPALWPAAGAGRRRGARPASTWGRGSVGYPCPRWSPATLAASMRS